MRNNAENRAERNERQDEARKVKIGNITMKKLGNVLKCRIRVQVNLFRSIVVIKLRGLREI